MPSSDMMHDGGAAAGFLSLAAFAWTWIKARIEKKDRDADTRRIVREEVNPALQQQLHQELKDDIADLRRTTEQSISELSRIVRDERDDAVAKATIAGINAGYRLRARGVTDGEA